MKFAILLLSVTFLYVSGQLTCYTACRGSTCPESMKEDKEDKCTESDNVCCSIYIPSLDMVNKGCAESEDACQRARDEGGRCKCCSGSLCNTYNMTDDENDA